MNPPAEKIGDLGLADLAARHGKRQVDEALFIGLDLDIVHGQENDGHCGMAMAECSRPMSRTPSAPP